MKIKRIIKTGCQM